MDSEVQRDSYLRPSLYSNPCLILQSLSSKLWPRFIAEIFCPSLVSLFFLVTRFESANFLITSFLIRFPSAQLLDRVYEECPQLRICNIEAYILAKQEVLHVVVWLGVTSLRSRLYLESRCTGFDSYCW